jgi:hypothetical protein
MPRSSTNPTAPLFKFQAFFDATLTKYSRRTGQGLADHPLTALLDCCRSPDDVLAIFEKQAEAFDEFRNGEPKLIKWLRPIVIVLHGICTNEIASSSPCVVSSFPGRCLITVVVSCLRSFAYGPFSWQLFPPAKAVMAGVGILLSVR